MWWYGVAEINSYFKLFAQPKKGHVTERYALFVQCSEVSMQY